MEITFLLSWFSFLIYYSLNVIEWSTDTTLANSTKSIYFKMQFGFISPSFYQYYLVCHIITKQTSFLTSSIIIVKYFFVNFNETPHAFVFIVYKCLYKIGRNFWFVQSFVENFFRLYSSIWNIIKLFTFYFR